jgi:hypothetical protein
MVPVRVPVVGFCAATDVKIKTRINRRENLSAMYRILGLNDNK